MKILALQTVLVLFPLWADGQGTFIYDQQSSDESDIAGDASIQNSQPFGQSFTPTLSSIGFIRLALQDGRPGIAGGATVYLNLRADSITGPILGSTDPVSMPDSFFGVNNFFFPNPVALTPGETYYFQPVVQPGGDFWHVAAYHYFYPGGTEFALGTAFPGADLWFREGIIGVPEPSGSLLLIMGGGLFAYARRLQRKNTRCV